MPKNKSNPFPSQPLTEGPSPAAVAWATRITPEVFSDVYLLASEIDKVAEEARRNERARIFHMSFSEIVLEFWKGRKLERVQSRT